MRVLGIDAATPPSSVALWSSGDDRVLHRSGPFGRETDAWIVAAVDDLLAEADVRLADLDLIAAAAGPGAFTGIRVGLATALGLARGVGLPVTGVGTLETMIDRLPRHGAASASGLACIDARRGEVYALLAPLARSPGRPPLEPRENADEDHPGAGAVWGPLAATPEAVIERLEERESTVAATGTGLDAYPEIASRCRTISPTEPLAVDVARRGGRLLAVGGREKLPPAHPRYLRQPDARPGRNPLEDARRKA